MRSPILVLHIIAGTLGMLSGFVAVFLRKGSRRHGLVGNVFVIAMLTLSASGVFLAVMKFQPGNLLGGTLTFYLVATAWMVARRGDGKTNAFDWGALLVVMALAVVELALGSEAATSATRLKYGYPAGPYFLLGSVAVLATLGDVRMLVRGGISGTRRIARHLWRMCFALFIASSSIFLARQHLFPAILRKAGVLMFLSFLPLALLIFWLIRVRYTKVFQRMMMTRGSEVHSVRTSPAKFAPAGTHSGITIERRLGTRAL
jgi:uncharacterized membrane protein